MKFLNHSCPLRIYAFLHTTFALLGENRCSAGVRNVIRCFDDAYVVDDERIEAAVKAFGEKS